MIIVSSLAGCIGEEYDTSEYESHVAELELQLIEANNTSTDLMLQLENANVSIEMMHSQVTELILQLENANATIEAMQSQSGNSYAADMSTNNLDGASLSGAYLPMQIWDIPGFGLLT